jgi:two-component system CheB/CheR fusion protein
MEDPPLRGTFLVVFADAARALPETAARGKPATVRGGAQKLVDRELGRVREELRATREEAQAASEELRSTNEELQSTNEELQSTNEELTTSKEEMQSMNEELQTLNAELQARVDALSEASNDMKNLLDSTAIAVLFLDERFNVRRFTPEAAKIIRLIPSDVGRPLTDLATTLDYGALYDDAREVLSTLASKETVVDTLDGRRFAVRIMPYRTSDNRIDGVVVTFICVPRAVPDAAPTSALS